MIAEQKIVKSSMECHIRTAPRDVRNTIAQFLPTRDVIHLRAWKFFECDVKCTMCKHLISLKNLHLSGTRDGKCMVWKRWYCTTCSIAIFESHCHITTSCIPRAKYRCHCLVHTQKTVVFPQPKTPIILSDKGKINGILSPPIFVY